MNDNWQQQQQNGMQQTYPGHQPLSQQPLPQQNGYSQQSGQQNYYGFQPGAYPPHQQGFNGQQQGGIGGQPHTGSSAGGFGQVQQLVHTLQGKPNKPHSSSQSSGGKLGMGMKLFKEGQKLLNKQNKPGQAAHGQAPGNMQQPGMQQPNMQQQAYVQQSGMQQGAGGYPQAPPAQYPY